MNFDEAMKALRNGMIISRPDWVGSYRLVGKIFEFYKSGKLAYTIRSMGITPDDLNANDFTAS